MRTVLLSFLPAVFGSLVLLATPASAVVVNATYNSAPDVPVAANGCTALGNSVVFAFNFAPATGTQLQVVRNTSRDPIVGRITGLARAQLVPLAFASNAKTFDFVPSLHRGCPTPATIRRAHDPSIYENDPSTGFSVLRAAARRVYLPDRSGGDAHCHQLER